MPTPDPGFVAELHRYDKNLRVRWAVRSQAWFIEEYQPRYQHIMRRAGPPSSSPLNMDIWEGFTAGYLHVLTVGPDLLYWRIVEPALHRTDLAKHALADVMHRIEQAEEAEEASIDRRIDTWNEANTREMYDELQWDYGNRIATPMRETPPPRFHVEQRDGYTITVRKGDYSQWVPPA